MLKVALQIEKTGYMRMKPSKVLWLDCIAEGEVQIQEKREISFLL